MSPSLEGKKGSSYDREQEEHPAASPDSAKWIIDGPICVARDSVQTGRNKDRELLSETRGTINHDKLYKLPGQF